MSRGDIITSSHRFRGPCSACGDGDTAMKYHNHDNPRLVQPSPSYTLVELMELAKQWRDEEDGIDSHAQWAVSSLLAWLARREQREQGEVSGG